MVKSYFKIAWRNLLKSKLFSLINIFGLAVGLAAFWLILLFVGYELSFDRFHENRDRIYRIVQNASWSDGTMHVPITSAPFAPALVDYYPEIEAAVRINAEGGGVINYKNNQLVVNDIYFVDSNFFDVFSFNLIHGDPTSALTNPQSIVISKKIAAKLFGDPSRALGKTVFFENEFQNIITGVMEDVPNNSHLQFSALRSLPSDFTSGWQEFNLYTYILLNEKASISELKSRLPQFFDKYLLSEMGPVDYRLELQPLPSIHLHSSLDFEIGPNGSIDNIFIFLAAAILILIIAAINYMNLTAARSSLRVKEVGVRKVIGSNKAQLIALFLIEAFLLSFIAMLLAVLFAELALPYIEQISGVEIAIGQFGTSNTILAFFVILVLVSVVCGIYPALFLSGFKTMASLKGQLGNIKLNIAIRKSMVIFQFVIAIIMMVGSWMIYQQLQFVLAKDLGFNKEQVLTFHLSSVESRKKIGVIKKSLMQNSIIKGVSAASNPIGNNNIGGQGLFLEQADGSMPEDTQIVSTFSVDRDFLETLEIDLLEGRNFSSGDSSDLYHAVLVNESLVKKAGWRNPLGKRIKNTSSDEKTNQAVVVGVVKDFHFYSLQHNISPLVLYKILPEDKDNVYVKIQHGDTKEALAFIEKTYSETDSSPFEFSFLDQNYSKQYQSEQRQSNLLLVFTSLAVFLALLGLFGLTAFSAEQRIKEIGIRKILGASLANLVALLSKDFIKLIVIAFFIAIPIAWYMVDRWLQYFAYRIEINWGVFALSGLSILAIAIVTVSYQAIKAALANPVEALKDE